MEFHISRAIRENLQIDGLLFSYTGNVIFADVSASRRLAARLNESLGPDPDPAEIVNAGALFAMGLIDELNHALIARYRKEIDPALWSDALSWFEQRAGTVEVDRLLLAFVQQFPNTAVLRGEVTPADWLQGSTEGLPNREAAIEELTLLWLSNANPAFRAFRKLFDDRPLQLDTPYRYVTSILPDYIDSRPPLAPETGSLLTALKAPMLASPDSVTGQLEFIREHWPKFLGENLSRVILAIDVAREEDVAIWMRFHPPGPDRHRHAAPGWGAEGFVGNEFIGFESQFGPGRPGSPQSRLYAVDYQAPLQEFEAFSADQAWMPNVVLIAKSTYVWLEQLSKKHGRHIHHLDHIPDEELRLLADRGITGLWLIGLWERSIASRTIKRLRGQTDSVASAYSLKDYNIAEDLGGPRAYSTLRDRAASVGIRLASDMVPNHMGIDSPWVIEHPDWFISRPESPFPVYQFNGPDISPDPRVEIKIEDHYYDQTDAAVVFRLHHHSNGQTRFVYHGNDGTSFAWNDTAQLDYSKAIVREHVIQTILHVARQFPIIRFDAAMVLARRHVQRLWFPLPGAGGSIPSRAEYAISQEQFDALMPHEFWREVVDRVAAEVPGTLLLAEAFWLLEGYFVRTLGMHRVYNSAFMNMLRDEENAKYRSYLKKTIEFDPDILKRYVNFMSNPDERTAIDQFGSGDKYFGVCTLLATLPGLPMFGHGQIEGFTERYGMEFKRARMEEFANEGLIAGHQFHIAPLLKHRRLFAESADFVLYDFWTDHGTVDENVFVYSNRLHDQRALIFFNNRYGSTRGTIHVSAASMNKASGNLEQRSLSDALGIPAGPALILAWRDTASNLEYLRRATDLHHHGMHLELRGYQYAVLLHWRELHSTEERPWDQLCDSLAGQGVHSVDDALSKFRLRSLHELLRQLISRHNAHLFAELATAEATRIPDSGRKPSETSTIPAVPATPPSSKPEPTPESEASAIDPRLAEFVKTSQHFFAELLQKLPSEAAAYFDTTSDSHTKAAAPESAFQHSLESAATALLQLPRIAHSFSPVWPPAVESVLPVSSIPSDRLWSPTLAWIVLASIPAPHTRARIFDELQFRSALAETFASAGIEGDNSWRAATRIRILLWLGDTPSLSIDEPSFWADPDVRWLTGIHDAGGKTYIVKELFEDLLCWLQLPALLAGTDLTQIEEQISQHRKHLRQAGYDLDAYLALQTGTTSSQKPATHSTQLASLEEPAEDLAEEFREPPTEKPTH